MSAPWYGDFPVNHTAVCMVFDGFAAATGAPAAITNFAAADIQIYKDLNATQRASASGIVVSAAFDTLSGIASITIDLSDNADAGFYVAGHEYSVAVSDVTIDSQTMHFWLGSFSIERAGGILALLKAGLAVSVSTMATPVGVSSASRNFGVSTMATPVGVSSASVNFGVSTVAILVGVSTLSVPVGVSSNADKGNYSVSSVPVLLGVSTLSVPVGVSSASVNLGVSTVAVLVGASTLAVPVGVSSASVLFGVSTLSATVSSVTGVTGVLAESYRANTSTGTLAQLMYEVVAHMGEVAFTTTTKQLNKLDHATAAATFTIDSSTAPTAITRAS